MIRLLPLFMFFLAAPALAAQPPLVAKPSLAGRHDANAPINISADKFVADTGAKTGTWTGNVIVLQSDMRMRANSVRLDVTGKDNKPDKIFAAGNVVVDSPNSGTATGDNGVYDVIRHTVTMTGRVVLTKDKNVMRGSVLTVNLDTGKAQLGATGPAPGPLKGSGRVEGVFTAPPPTAKPH